MNGLYNTTMDVYTKSSGGDFETTSTWTYVDCFDCKKSKLSVRIEGNTIVADYIVYCDYTDEIDEEHRIIINETAYDIYDIDDPDDMNHHMEVLVKKLNDSDYEDMDI